MTALRKAALATVDLSVADMTMGLATDLMPCSNIENGDMIAGAAVAPMPCST